mgnify:CR=1 FL=1
MTKEELKELKNELGIEYDKYKSMNLSLDMSRGKPGTDQLDISLGVLMTVEPEDYISETGFDYRNYGILDGIPECKKLFADLLQVDAENIIVCGNSSLNLMFDYLTQCYYKGVCGNKPWKEQGKVKFICPVPGYDRHFSIAEFLGIEMIPVMTNSEGPDMDAIRELVKDPMVKGAFCVPKYSNPTGIIYSDRVVKEFAELKPAADDFRVIWDNAYCIHDLVDSPKQLANIFDYALKNGTEKLFVEFTSTSKISFPGAGVSCIAASTYNVKDILGRMKYQTIGFDKLNQLRHIKYFKDVNGIREHMKKHASIIRPKFDIVLEALENEIKPIEIGKWIKPEGGYFISYDVTVGSAKRIGELCKDLGLVLTSVGATYPYGNDPDDKNIRIAPTYPSQDDLRMAVKIFCLCAKIAAIESLLK